VIDSSDRVVETPFKLTRGSSMNHTNRLKQNSRRFAFSNILAKEVLLERMEDRVLLASTPTILVTNVGWSNRGNNSIGKYDQNGLAINSSYITGLDFPVSMAFDSAGNLYVGNGVTKGLGSISKYSPNGTLINSSLITGLDSPSGLALDMNDNIYVTYPANGSIRKYSPDGALLNASFLLNTGDPTGIAFDRAGFIYIIDYNGKVRKYDSSGNITDNPLIAGLVNPIGIAIDSLGFIYTANAGNDTIGKYNPDGSAINTNLISGLSTPLHLAFDAYDNLYIPNNTSQSVSEFTSSGTTINRSLISGLNGAYSVIAIPKATSTGLSVNTASSVFGQSITLNAVVTSTGVNIPSGFVASFYDGNNFLGNAIVRDGIATLSVSTLSVGSHTITSKIVDPTHIYLSSVSSGVSINVTTSVASALLITGGSNQSTVINSTYSYPLQLRVVDAYGNPVPNTLVTFSQPTTGPSITFQGSNAAYSDANGYVVSSTIMAVNSPGSFFVTANASGVNSAAFYLTNATPTPTLQSILVQQGSKGRSFVRYVDININDPATVTSIVNSLNTSAPRITLTNTGLTGKTKKAVTIKGLAKAIGNTLRIDFGTKGIGGNAATNTADSSYLISLDVDGNGSLETSQRFFRLLGDVNGDKVVDSKDTALVTANLNKGGMNQPGDANGDGKVNATDVSYVRKAQRRRIRV